MAKSRSSRRPVNAKWPRWFRTELELETVLGRRLRGGHDAGVVDEQVDVLVLGVELIASLAHGDERREVRVFQAGLGTGEARGDPLGGGSAFVEISHGEHDVRAFGRQRGRGLEAQPGVGAGHDGHPVQLLLLMTISAIRNQWSVTTMTCKRPAV